MTSPDGWITCELQSNYKYENLKPTKSSIDRKKKKKRKEKQEFWSMKQWDLGI